MHASSESGRMQTNLARNMAGSGKAAHLKRFGTGVEVLQRAAERAQWSAGPASLSRRTDLPRGKSTDIRTARMELGRMDSNHHSGIQSPFEHVPSLWRPRL